MSDIDKFVLQYRVDLADAVSRLEKLNSKVKEVNANGSGFAGKMKQGVGELTNAFGSLDSTLASVVSRFGAMGSVLGAVGATVALVAKGIKDINAMNALSYKTGIGATSMESIQRNLMKSGGGLIDRDQAKDALQKNRDFWQRARINPGGTESLAASRMGMNSSTMTPSAFFSGTAAWMKANPGAKGALAIGGQIGYTPQMINAMAAAGSGVTANALSGNALVEHQKAQEAAARVTKFIGDLNEKLAEFKFEAADKVISFFSTIGGWMDKINAKHPNAKRSGFGWDRDVPGQFSDKEQAKIDAAAAKQMTPQQIELKAKEESIAKAAADKAQADVEAEDAAAAAQAEDTATWQQILAQFSGAVGKFSNTIDLQQAWAAWAGMVGQAVGLSGSSKPQDLSRNSAAYSPQGFGRLGGSSSGSGSNQFSALESKYGLPSGLLDSVWAQESGRGANMRSPAGAMGHFQFMPATAKQYGLQNPDDLAESSDAAARMYRDLLKQNGGDLPKALAAYNWGQGNLSSKGMGAAPKETRDYIASVQRRMTGNGSGGLPASLKTEAIDPSARGSWSFSGGSFKRGKGESIDTVAQSGVAKALASGMGHNMTAAQILSGNVTKGDLNWEASNMMSSLVNSRQALTMKLKTPMTDVDRSQTEAALRSTDLDIQNLQKFMPTLESNAQPGGRSITIGEQRIIVNAGAVTDPQQLAQEIQKELDAWMAREMDAAINQAANGRAS